MVNTIICFPLSFKYFESEYVFNQLTSCPSGSPILTKSQHGWSCTTWGIFSCGRSPWVRGLFPGINPTPTIGQVRPAPAISLEQVHVDPFRCIKPQKVVGLQCALPPHKSLRDLILLPLLCSSPCTRLTCCSRPLSTHVGRLWTSHRYAGSLHCWKYFTAHLYVPLVQDLDRIEAEIFLHAAVVQSCVCQVGSCKLYWFQRVLNSS